MKKIYKKLIVAAASLLSLSSIAQVSAYSFTQTVGTYNAITGGTVYGNTTSDDEYFVDPAVPLGGGTSTGVGIPIGFNFIYNGNTYDRFAINNNGWISLGQSTLTPQVDMNTTSAYTSLSSGAATTPTFLRSRIAAFSLDLQGQTGSTLRVELLGASPNRTLVVQWGNYRRYNQTGMVLNFQIRLAETTNIVTTTYGAFTGVATNYLPQVGLGGSASTDFNNRSVLSTGTWSTSTAGAANTANAAFVNTLTPTNGLNYQWTPPPVCSGAPAANTVAATTTAICSGGSSNLSLASSYTVGGIAYQWFSAPALSGPYTAITNATLTTYAATSLTSTVFYQAVITCTNGPASTTATPIQVSVTPVPSVSVTPSAASICVPVTSTVSLVASGAASYSWSPSASLNSSSVATVIASPTLTTVYTVTGTTSGCSGTATTVVNVNATPVLSINSATVCANNSATLTTSATTPTYCQPGSTNGTSGGDYVGGVQLANITNTTTGLAAPYYTVYPNIGNTTTTLTAGNTYTLYLNPGTWSSSNGMAAWIDYNKNGNLNEAGEKLGEVFISGAFPTTSVVVFTVPASAFNGLVRFRVREVWNTTNIDACTTGGYGETEDYDITIVGGAEQYTYTPSTFLNATFGSSVVSTPSITTNYTVSTTVNGCVGAATSTVLVNTTTITVNSGSICAGDSFTLSPNGAATYTFSSGPVVTPTATSNYSVVGTGTNGCVSAQVISTVAVNANPTVSVANGTICSGSSFTLNPSGATSYTYSTGPVVTPSANSSYTVTGANAAGCTNSTVATVSVNATPTVNATSSASLICNGSPAVLTATGASTYSWNTTATTSTISVTPSVTTSYTVTGTTNGCSNSFVFSQAVSPCTGVNANAATVSGILVYPNPNTGEFTIELNNGSVKNIDVMDLTGRVIISNSSSNDKVDFNINTLANGVYYVRIQSNNTVEVIKIIKQ